MIEQSKTEAASPAPTDERRAFLAKAGKTALAVPAAALLLAATKAKAAIGSGRLT